MVQAFETTYRETYSGGCSSSSSSSSTTSSGTSTSCIEGLSTVLQRCADAVTQADGHVYYLGDGCAGIMGFIDASEMPDTYGCPSTR